MTNQNNHQVEARDESGVLKPPRSLPNRDFIDREFHLTMQRDYEDIRHRRKQRKGRPSDEEMILIGLERKFEAFYKRFL